MCTVGGSEYTARYPKVEDASVEYPLRLRIPLPQRKMKYRR